MNVNPNPATILVSSSRFSVLHGKNSSMLFYRTGLTLLILYIIIYFFGNVRLNLLFQELTATKVKGNFRTLDLKEVKMSPF